MASSQIFQNNLNFGLFRAGFIYTLSCPDTMLVRYVGKTFSPKERFARHVSLESREKSKRALWVNGLIKKGKKPIIDIIDDCDEFNWIDKEVFYIKFYKSIGAKLLNMSNGGEQGALNYKFTESQSEKLSKSLKGKPKTKEHIENAIKARIESIKKNPLLKKKLSEISARTLMNMTDEQKKLSKIKRNFAHAKRCKIKLCDYYKISESLKTKKQSLKKTCEEFGFNVSLVQHARKKFIKK